jgi:amino acid adenylation domain-containing protein
MTRLPLLPDVVAERASHQGDAAAVEWAGGRLSYRQLDRSANALAAELRRLGLGAEEVVGVCVGRGPDPLVAMLGVMRAGGAYLPLDPEYPRERLDYMVRDARVRLAVVGAGSGGWDGVTEVTTRLAEADAGPCELAGQRLAYVIYTSGSTGRPKGVMISHHSLANLLAWQRDWFGLSPGSRVLQWSSSSFDAWIWEATMALGSGATLCVPPTRGAGEDIGEQMRRLGVGAAMLTPSALRTVDPGRVPDLHTVTSGGEPCPASLARRWSDRRFVNAYGPTETTVVASVADRPRPGPAGEVPLGDAVGGTRLYVLDAEGRQVGDGMTGELCVAGEGVARGYLGRPALTAERFVPEGPAGPPGARMYRTGDLVRLTGGTLVYVGRTDEQVKVRGHRIEPGEVEAALRDCDLVAECAVVARQLSEDDRQLVAYVVWHEGSEPSIEELRAYLRGRLPDHLVPARYLSLDSLPLLPNGKVDRRGLPEPRADRSELASAYVGPRTRAEADLARVWEQVLGLERVGVADDFFELGGDSLLALRAAAQAGATLGVPVESSALLTHRTIAALAGRLAAEAAEAAPAVPDAEPAPAAVASFPVAATGPLARRRLLALLPDLAEIEDWYGLTPTQAGVLFHSVADAGLYHPQLTCVVRDAEPEALAAAYQDAVERHPVLRTGFLWEGLERPVQAVWRRAHLPVTVEEWSGLSREALRHRLDQWLDADRRRPFELSRPPLVRLALHRLPDRGTQVVWSFHHALLDGWSVADLLDEVVTGRTPPRRPFREHVAWLAAQDPTRAEPHWLALRSVAIPTPLPDRSATGEAGFGRLVAVLPAGVREAVVALARRERLGLGAICHAAWALVLSDGGVRRDVVFGTTVSGRSQAGPAAAATIGLLANSLPLHVAVDGTEALVDWLRSVQDRLAEVGRLDATPLSSVRAWCQVAPGRPLFDSLVAFERYATPPGVEDLDTVTQTNYPLNLVASDRADTLRLRVTYHRAWFSDAAAARVLARWSAALAAIVTGRERVADVWAPGDR